MEEIVVIIAIIIYHYLPSSSLKPWLQVRLVNDKTHYDDLTTVVERFIAEARNLFYCIKHHFAYFEMLHVRNQTITKLISTRKSIHLSYYHFSPARF